MSLLSLGSVGIGRDLAMAGQLLARDASVPRTRLTPLSQPPAPPSAPSVSAGEAPAVSGPPSVSGPPVAVAQPALSAQLASGPPTAGVAGFGQLLVAQIPSEALLAYTTLLALFTATAGGSYRAGRWVLYGAAIVVCAAVVLASYFAHRHYDFDDSPTESTSAASAPQSAAATPPTSAPTPAATSTPASTPARVPGKRRLHLPILPTATAMASMAVYGLTVPGSPLQFQVSGTAFGIWSGCLAVGGGVMMSIFAPFLGKGNAATVVPKQG